MKSSILHVISLFGEEEGETRNVRSRSRVVAGAPARLIEIKNSFVHLYGPGSPRNSAIVRGVEFVLLYSRLRSRS